MVGVGVTHSWDSQNKCLPKAMLCPAIAQGWSRGSRGMEALTPRSPRLCGRQTPKYRLTAGTEGSWEPGHRDTGPEYRGGSPGEATLRLASEQSCTRLFWAWDM